MRLSWWRSSRQPTRSSCALLSDRNLTPKWARVYWTSRSPSGARLQSPHKVKLGRGNQAEGEAVGTRVAPFTM